MDHTTFIEAIKAHPYKAITTLAVAQGRVAAVCAGVYAAKDMINPFIAYVILVAMSMAGDILYFSVGYFVNNLGRRTRRLFIKERCRVEAEQIAQKGTGRGLLITLITCKLIGIGSKPAIVAAGLLRMPPYRFVVVTTSCTLVSFLAYLAIGYFLGDAILNLLF